MCPLYFDTKVMFDFHSSLHLSIKNEQNDEIKDEITIECSICEAKFAPKASLKIHIQSVHEGKKHFECFVCNTKFLPK